MFLDAGQVDKAFYDEMKKYWSEAQIMELGAFIAFHYGMQMFMRSLGAEAVSAACAGLQLDGFYVGGQVGGAWGHDNASIANQAYV